MGFKQGEGATAMENVLKVMNKIAPVSINDYNGVSMQISFYRDFEVTEDVLRAMEKVAEENPAASFDPELQDDDDDTPYPAIIITTYWTDPDFSIF